MEGVKSAYDPLSLLHGFRDDFFQEEGFGTVDTSRLTFVRNDQQPVAFRARLGKRPLPGGKFAIGVIDTAKESAPLAGFSFHKFALIERA